jgi:hypothetical protein
VRHSLSKSQEAALGIGIRGFAPPPHGGFTFFWLFKELNLAYNLFPEMSRFFFNFFKIKTYKKSPF